MEKESGAGHASGVIESQPEGRASLPPVNNDVPAAKADEGAHARAVKVQLGENLKPLNSHVKESQQYGPNN